MSQCSKCGATFSCGMADDRSAAPCWCTQYPPLPMPQAGSAALCYCPGCLAQATAGAPSGCPPSAAQPD
jgi:hypothetical protein